MAYSVSSGYLDKIYSQSEINDLKIWFDDTELQDASVKCEKITRKARILPDDGSKRFSLDNFISTNIEVILHNVDLEDIVDPVRISIGTLVGNDYEYVPLGIFNIQDKPEINGNKIVLKLRDNRVKFDFGYNAKTLIDIEGGAATKMQILDDICSQAGVTNTITSFNGDSDLIGIYDSTITATTYVSYLMEQAGLIAVIDRQGQLAAVDLTDLETWEIPLSIIEGYEIGTPYQIDRVVYESGIIKYETSNDETLDTLYINSGNPYVSQQSQVDYIYNKLQDFTIDSATTKKVLGNPAIDPYDLIEVYNDLDGSNDVLFTTLANTTYTYNGVHRDVFDTQIGKEERTENVSLKGDDAFKKYAKTSIDNINGEITLVVGNTNANTESINTLTDTVNNQSQSIEELGTRLTQTAQSITATVTALQEEVSGAATSVKTTSVTINDSGLTVATDTSKIQTTMTNDTFKITDSGGTELAFFGYDENQQTSISKMDNLTVTHYLTTGVHRIEEIEGENRTGFFYIGG